MTAVPNGLARDPLVGPDPEAREGDGGCRSPGGRVKAEQKPWGRRVWGLRGPSSLREGRALPEP